MAEKLKFGTIKKKTAMEWLEQYGCEEEIFRKGVLSWVPILIFILKERIDRLEKEVADLKKSM
jgi:hypothetical protein